VRCRTSTPRGVEPLVHAVDSPGRGVADVVVAQPDPRRDLLGLDAARARGLLLSSRA
jgi:hypothetical protein